MQAAHPVLHQRRHWMCAGDIDPRRWINVPAFRRTYVWPKLSHSLFCSNRPALQRAIASPILFLNHCGWTPLHSFEDLRISDSCSPCLLRFSYLGWRVANRNRVRTHYLECVLLCVCVWPSLFLQALLVESVSFESWCGKNL